MYVHLARILRSSARPIRADRGFSMTELIVAIGLFSILATLIITAFTTFSTTFNRDRSSTSNVNMAAAGMNELTRVIRGGTSVPLSVGNELPVFESANRESLVLHTYLDTDALAPVPMKVRFEVNSTTRELRETRWTAYPNPAAPRYWLFRTASDNGARLVASRIIAPAAGETAMFSYYRIDPTTRNDALMPIPTGGFNTAQLLEIVAVEVTVKVQTDTTNRADPMTLVNRVGIPNLGISRLGL